MCDARLVSVTREDLLGHLEAYYRSCGWPAERASDSSVRARGSGGVTWIGLAVMPEDITGEGFALRLRDLSGERMPGGGERCPLELLPAAECADELRELLSKLGLSELVSIYSLAAAA
jgi:hypothetical protein